MLPLFAVSIYWHLPVVLVLFSLVYSATRHDQWDRIIRESVRWIVQIGGFLLIVAVVITIASSLL